MNIDERLRRLYRRANPVLLAASAAAVLLAADGSRRWLRDETQKREAELEDLQDNLDHSSQSLGEELSLKELKSRDLEHFKRGLSKLTESRRTIYEAGLLLQEEKRLLDKQWEMMTTYFLIDAENERINLMRGEQSLESYKLKIAAPVPIGAVAGGELKAPPALTQIVSKERFAHPERGKYEEKDGQVQWEPPQVGTSIRSNALGEFVMFTNSSLILHGTPKKKAEHEQYPHYCLQLDSNVARKLYAGSFIGTKILVEQDTRLIKLKDNRQPPKGE